MEDIEIVAYRTNVYAFYNRLKKDYSDQEGNIEFEYIDLPLFLNDYFQFEETAKLDGSDFSDIILIFDFDPQDPQFSKGKLEVLLDNFSNSTELGKLYINYPMVESYKDIISFEKKDYLYHSVHIDVIKNKRNNYKKFVHSRSCISSIEAIDKTIANSLFDLNASKFKFIMNSSEYDVSMEHSVLCQKQFEKLSNDNEIWVINTSILHLYDEYGKIK